jgi:hypothetical protein
MAKIKIDRVHDYEEEVDIVKELKRQYDELNEKIEVMKENFRQHAAELIGVDESSIEFVGTCSDIRVTFQKDRKPKFNKDVTIDDVPQELKEIFFRAFIKTELKPVKNFVKLSEEHPEILDYMYLEDPTAAVYI